MPTLFYLKTKIENIVGSKQIKKIKKDFLKSKNPFATKIIVKDKNFVVVDLSEKLNRNDIIFFQEINGNIEKAITICKGRNGITCVNKEGDKLKVRYSSILNFEKR